MKKLVIFVMICSLCLLCISCQREESSIPTMNQTYYAAVEHGIISPDPEIRELIVKNGKVSLSYFIENIDNEMTYGLRIFVNGILHSYYANEQYTSMYLTKLGVGQTDYIDISFSPESMALLKDNYVTFALMLDPYRIPDDDITGHLQPLTQLLPWKLIFDEYPTDIENDSLVCNDFDFESFEIDIEDDFMNGSFDITVNDKEKYAFAKPDIVSIPVSIITTSKGFYRICVFLNSEIVSVFNDRYYFDISMEKNHQYKFYVKINTYYKNLMKTRNTLYAIAAPINCEQEMAQILKSSSIIIEMK